MPPSASQHTGLARALSKLGHCSRSQGWDLVLAGRVRVNGRIVRDPEFRVAWSSASITVDDRRIENQAMSYLMLNKPRGLVTTAADEQGRDTVYSCLEGKNYPFVSPVGRLDKASEGLLLLTNDTAWAARITSPESHLDKTYHVQIDQVGTPDLCAALVQGREVEGERLVAKAVRVLRAGEKNSWLEVILDEGRNRHIRRLLAEFGIEVMRLVRVRIGDLELGSLAKGQVRALTSAEAASLSPVRSRT